MRKLTTCFAWILCMVSLVGCSKINNNTVALINGNIMNGSKVLEVTEYSGYEAKTVMDGIGTITYYLCDTTDSCPHNAANILVEDMTDYKGKCKYYTMYLETDIYLYVPYGNGYIECYMALQDAGLLPVSQAVEMMYQEAGRLKLSDSVMTVLFDGILEVNVADWEFHVREDEIVIPGLLRIKADDGSVTATNHITINDKPVAKASTAKYDYYQYNGVLIQVAVGTDITRLVTLK